jgi:hypothetical protein
MSPENKVRAWQDFGGVDQGVGCGPHPFRLRTLTDRILPVTKPPATPSGRLLTRFRGNGWSATGSPVPRAPSLWLSCVRVAGHLRVTTRL